MGLVLISHVYRQRFLEVGGGEGRAEERKERASIGATRYRIKCKTFLNKDGPDGRAKVGVGVGCSQVRAEEATRTKLNQR